MDLDFVRIECEIISELPAQLAASLYEMLLNYEAQFKASCCQSQQLHCISCSHLIGCPYRIVFDQRLSSDPEVVRRHQKPSLPFALNINVVDGNRDTCVVGLVVIGSAINYFDFFYTALLRTVEAAVYSVNPSAKYTLHAYSLDYQGVRHEITPSAALSESVILLSGQHILQNTMHSDSVKLALKSPLRMLSNGSIVHRFDFGMFFRSQLRRCSSLCAYYGAGKLDLDYAQLSVAAQNVAVFDDKILYTQPSGSKRLNRAGLTGTAECAGLVEPMFSLLLLGSYFNAGKGAAFGSGLYRLEVS